MGAPACRITWDGVARELAEGSRRIGMLVIDTHVGESCGHDRVSVDVRAVDTSEPGRR